MKSRFWQLSAFLLLSIANVWGQGVLDITDTNESPLERAKRAREELALRMQEDRIPETLEARIIRLKDELAAAEAELAERDRARLKSTTVEVSAGALVSFMDEKSIGTGFIAEMRGRTFLITNIHVLGVARNASIQTSDGVDVELPSYGFVSRARDVAIVPIEWEGPTLPLSQSLNFDEVETGDEVAIIGHPEGAGVKRLKGSLRSLNEDELEVAMKSVPRSSGSPLMHQELGNVIGILSHYRDLTPAEASLRREWGSKGESGRLKPVVRDIRSFCSRLDGEVEWRQVTLVDLYSQAETYHRYEDRSQVMSRIGRELIADGEVLDYQDHDSLGYLYDHFDAYFPWSNLNGMSSHVQRQLKRFITGMLSELQTDRQRTRETLYIEFYQRQYDSMEAKRNRAVQDFTQFGKTRLD